MTDKDTKPWDEADIRLAIYHTCGKQLALAPVEKKYERKQRNL